MFSGELSCGIAAALAAKGSEVAAAMRLLAESANIVAEGAAATTVAAALAGQAGGEKIACVISGGNIDNPGLQTILAGEMPLA